MISVRVRCALGAAALLLLILAQTAVRAQSVTTLYSFSLFSDGALPLAGLIQDSDGNLYGTTSGGGANDGGTVFLFTLAGTLTTLYPIDLQNQSPYGGVVQASDGNLYGTTYVGGVYGDGMIFRTTPFGSNTILYSFDYLAGDGKNPEGSLIQASDGNLYGTTEVGGAYGWGTVFRITPSGTLTTLYSFDWSDGADPKTGLIQASDGNLYGTTEAGGTSGGWGTVFRIMPSGAFTTLHSLDRSAGDGYSPAGLIQASDGNLYGTTQFGGANTGGTVFRITLSGTFTTLHSFDVSGSDGHWPLAGLIQASDGNLYGTTYVGGTYDQGTVFRITLSGTFTTLYSFDYSAGDGYLPEAGLMQASDGNLYGTTYQGGAYDWGTIFRVNLSNINSVPTANNDTYQVYKNTAISVNAVNGVLANDSNGGSGTLTAHLISPPTSGSLTLNPDGSFTYTPNKYFLGADSFHYANNNGVNNSNTATVTLNVAVPTTLTVTNTTSTGAAPFTLSARLTLAPNTGLGGQPLTFLLNGVSVGSAVTKNNGRASVTALPSVSGVSTITVQFAGNGNYAASSGMGTLTVQPSSTLVTLKSVSGRAGKTVLISGKLQQSPGTLGLVGQTVTVLVDGNVVGTTTTGKSGAISFIYLVPASTTVGLHTITASYGGDGVDTQCSGSATLTVK